MNPRLLERFSKLCLTALRATPERDADPVVDALGYAVWLTALGERQPVAAGSRSALRELGQRTLLTLESSAREPRLQAAAFRPAHVAAARPVDVDSTASAKEPELDLEDGALASRAVEDIVRAGLRVLDGVDITTAKPALHATKLHPPTGTLARMLSGMADGLTAGRYGLHALGCTRCQQELRSLGVVKTAPPAAAPMRLAAAAAARVRAPEEGVVVARIQKPAAEAVLFEDTDARRLALYTDAGEQLRVVAEGVTTEDTRDGYWIGRLSDSIVREVTGTLYHATLSVPHSVDFHVLLDALPRAKRAVKKSVVKKSAVKKSAKKTTTTKSAGARKKARLKTRRR